MHRVCRWRYTVSGLLGGLAITAAGCGGSTSETAPATTATAPSSTTTSAPSTTTTTTTTTVAPTTTTIPPEPARYRLVVKNTWSEETQPGGVPGNAHLSWLAGATHNDEVTLWSLDEPASPGVTEMAETGRTNILLDEIAAAGEIDSTLSWQWWFCAASTSSDNCGETILEFDIDPAYPYVTLVSMIGPTPDWFVGVDGLALLEDGRWRQEVVVLLTPYDGGTRTEQDRFALGGPRNDPPEPISLITDGSGQIVGPQPIGSLTFTLLMSG